MPKPLPNCLAFQVSALFDLDVNGFAAYLIDENNATLVGANEGVGVDGRNYLLSGGDCEADPIPPNCPFPLVIAYNFTITISTSYAFYRVNSATVPVHTGRLSGASVDVVCMESPNCAELTIGISIQLIIGGSFDADAFAGDYAAFFNGTKITSGVLHPLLDDSVRFGMGC